MKKQRVLVVGLGGMGLSHALAYARIPGFEVVGLCQRSIASRALPAGPRPAPPASPITRRRWPPSSPMSSPSTPCRTPMRISP